MSHTPTHTLQALCQPSWDEGRDPIDDPAVQEYLLAHPEYLEAFADLRQTISALASLPHTPAQQSRSLARWLPAAAIVLAAMVWWSTGGTGSDAGQSTLTPGFLSADYRQETRRSFTGSIVTREVHESRSSEHGMYAVLRIEHRKPIHPESK